MEVKRAENEIATIGKEHEDELVHKIFIAAITTLAMACLKRILVMFFVEQWRPKVFLILNLILLAIFVTSIRSDSSGDQEMNDNAKPIKKQEKKRREECDLSTQDKESKQCYKLGKRTARDAQGIGQKHYKVESEAHSLSKEELNERVEAFIAMFRQHLVADARRGKNQFHSRSKRVELFNLHKGSKFTNSSARVNSSVAYRHSF